MRRICIAGNGNVATHLSKALIEKSEDVVAIDSRNPEGYIPEEGDICLLAVKDEAIGETAGRIIKIAGRGNISDFLIAHTSGSVSLDVLKNQVGDRWGCGVFYPLQTFSKDAAMKYDEIPFLIEGDSESSTRILRELAMKISDRVAEADSHTRGDYHIAAVVSCNFSNYLHTLSDEFLRSKKLDFKMLLPLLKTTVSKLEEMYPSEAQTGPAVRGDKKIVCQHLERLADYPKAKKIYKEFSEMIMADKNNRRRKQK